MYHTCITFPDSSLGEKKSHSAVVVPRQPRSTHAISPDVAFSPESKIQRHNSGARLATFRKHLAVSCRFPYALSLSLSLDLLRVQDHVSRFPTKSREFFRLHRGLLRLKISLPLPHFPLAEMRLIISPIFDNITPSERRRKKAPLFFHPRRGRRDAALSSGSD